MTCEELRSSNDNVDAEAVVDYTTSILRSVEPEELQTIIDTMKLAIDDGVRAMPSSSSFKEGFANLMQAFLQMGFYAAGRLAADQLEREDAIHNN
jgi:hypothetical protein